MGINDMKNMMESIKASTRSVSLKITDEPLKNEVDRLHDRTVVIMQEYQDGVNNVMTNTTLSQLGKDEAKNKLLTIAFDGLATIEAGGDKYQREVERLIESVGEDTSADPVLEYLTQREIRDRVMNDATLEVQYTHAVNTNTNQALVDALEKDPLPRDFVTDASRARTRQNKMMSRSPKDALRVKDIDRYDACLKNTTAAARQIMTQFN